MAKAWRIILIIVLIAIVLGAVLIGVGIMTGADYARLYGTVADHYNLVKDPMVYVQYVQSVIDAVTAEVSGQISAVTVIG